MCGWLGVSEGVAFGSARSSRVGIMVASATVRSTQEVVMETKMCACGEPTQDKFGVCSLCQSEEGMTDEVGPALPDVVLELLTHIESVVDEENWNKIDVAKWNAVTNLARLTHSGGG